MIHNMRINEWIYFLNHDSFTYGICVEITGQIKEKDILSQTVMSGKPVALVNS